MSSLFLSLSFLLTLTLSQTGTGTPTVSSSSPSSNPTIQPTNNPTNNPTSNPTVVSVAPTQYPTMKSLQLGKVSLYPTELPLKLHGSIAHYDETRDIIWLFGGKNESNDKLTMVLTFDYKTDTFNTSKPNLGYPAFGQSNNGIVIDDILYFLEQNTHFLMSYDLETGVTNRNVTEYLTNATSKAIAGDLENKIVYISGGFFDGTPLRSLEAWAYNITSDSVTILPNSISGHNKAASVWNNNLLCMFADDTHKTIDCLDTLSLTNWHVLNDEFNEILFWMYAIPFKDNWMVMYGGRYNGGAWIYTNTIYYYEISTDKLYLSQFGLITDIAGVAVANVHTTDEVFIFGGSRGSGNGGKANFTQYSSLTTLSPSNYPTIHPTMNPSIYPTVTSFSPTRNPTITRLNLGNVTLYPAIMPMKLSGAIAYYDETRDLIWLFGGKNESNDRINTVMTFDYKSDSFNTSKTKLGYSIFHHSNNGFVIDDILYFIDDRTHFLMSYELETGITNVNVSQFVSAVNFKALAADPENKIIYISGGGDNIAWAYNITADSVSLLPDSISGHNSAATVWNNNLLCMFGSSVHKSIDCLDTLSLTNWTVLNDEFNEKLFWMYGIPFKDNWMVMYGGRWNNEGDWTWTSVIYVYSISHDRLYLSQSGLVTNISAVAVAYVHTTDEVFIFGGARGSANGGRANFTQYSSLATLSPTLLPTIYPTNNPTITPTIVSNNPTENPTNFPTNLPSKNPSFNPTKLPSNFPSNVPSENPSFNPTNDPSNFPSKQPSKHPSFFPTNYPTISPSKASNSSSFESQNGVSLLVVILLTILSFLIVLIGLYFIVKRLKSKESESEDTVTKLDKHLSTDIELQPPGASIASEEVDHEKHTQEQVTPHILEDHQITEGEGKEEELVPTEGEETKLEDNETIVKEDNGDISSDSENSHHEEMYQNNENDQITSGHKNTSGFME